MCENGIFVPSLPPCLDGKCDDICCLPCNRACGRPKGKGCCIDFFDQNCFCRWFAGAGRSWFDRHRGPIFVCMAILTTIEILCCIYSCLALSDSEFLLRNAYWSKGVIDNDEAGTVDIYIGITNLLADVDGISDKTYKEVVSWDDACDADEISETNRATVTGLCSGCQDAVGSLYTTTILTTLAKLGQLGTDLQRSTRKGDVNCQKAIGFITGIVATVATLTSYQVFVEKCWRNFDEVKITGNEMDWTLGPGFISIIIMIFLAVPDGLIHLLTPVPPENRTRSPYGFPWKGKADEIAEADNIVEVETEEDVENPKPTSSTKVANAEEGDGGGKAEEPETGINPKNSSLNRQEEV